MTREDPRLIDLSLAELQRQNEDLLAEERSHRTWIAALRRQRVDLGRARTLLGRIGRHLVDRDLARQETAAVEAAAAVEERRGAVERAAIAHVLAAVDQNRIRTTNDDTDRN